MSRAPCVYIMTNKRNGTLYTGVTSNLAERARQHREGLAPGFTSRYAWRLGLYAWITAARPTQRRKLRTDGLQAIQQS